MGTANPESMPTHNPWVPGLKLSEPGRLPYRRSPLRRGEAGVMRVDTRGIMCVSTNRAGTARTALPRHQEVES